MLIKEFYIEINLSIESLQKEDTFVKYKSNKLNFEMDEK